MVEKKILETVDTLREALGEWKNLFQAHRDAERDFDAAYAKSRLAAAAAGVTPNDRKYHADTDPTVQQARQVMDTAEVLYKYGDERLRSVRSVLSAYQSLAKSIQTAYGMGA